MKLRSCVLFGMVFAGMGAYAEPINLGCSARGPLAALSNSAAFREAIGAANPANFLGSVYDAHGQKLTAQSVKSLHCPLFIDSEASPSASASKAILRGEEQARVAAKAPRVMAHKDAGKLAPRAPEQKQIATAAPITPAAKTQITPERAKSPAAAPLPVRTAQASRQAAPAQTRKPRSEGLSAAQFKDSSAVTFGLAVRLIKKIDVPGKDSRMEVDPFMMLVYFLLLFIVTGALALLVTKPRPRSMGYNKKVDVRQAAFERLGAAERMSVRQMEGATYNRQKAVQAAATRSTPSWVTGD